MLHASSLRVVLYLQERIHAAAVAALICDARGEWVEVCDDDGTVLPDACKVHIGI